MASEIYAIALVINLVAAVLVYQDAKRCSSQSAALWALLVVVAGFILGPLIYVLVGRDRTGSSGRHRDNRRRNRRKESDDEPMNVDDSGPF